MNAIPFEQLCQQLSPSERHLLTQSRAGIEKEGLRVDAKGHISQAPHAHGLGSALCHPQITTDYSESMLELITAAHQSRNDLLQELADIHRFVYSQIGTELLWPGSMPCVLNGEKSVPIANYGKSNSGMMKHVYRHGLWHRYGRIMQAITGIHYNFSLPDELWAILHAKSGQDMPLQDFKSAGMLAIIRNFRRHAYIFNYLFGASPALDESFFGENPHQLAPLGEHTLYAPHATCLRMTDIGYKSVAQQSIQVCYNTLPTYIQSLRDALTASYAPYDAIGVVKDGQYQQLNSHLLQIENEFYSEIRPKRTPKAGQTPLNALYQDGVDYIELRIFDLDPFLPLGINQRGIELIDSFLLHCLLSKSPMCTAEENQHIKDNLYASASQGLKPDLPITVLGKRASLREHATQLLQDMRQSLASVPENSAYQDAINHYAHYLEDSSKTPAAKLIATLEEQKLSYRAWMLKMADFHRLQLGRPLEPEAMAAFVARAQQSHQDQAQQEQNDRMSFEAYNAQYQAQALACVY